jgi:hypothetical protein
MMHPQPTSVLLLNHNYDLRVDRHAAPGPLLGLLVGLRRPVSAVSDTATAATAVEAVRPAPHDSGQSPRVRSVLGGRLQRARRRRGARALRRRGDLHIAGRRANRRER